MRWQVHSSQPVYRSPWVDVWLDDVELPDGRHIEHHAIRFPRQSVGAVVVDADHTLLIWRHRYLPDVWGWEIPAGWVEPGEDPATAIAREIEEETGYRPTAIAPLMTYHPMAGISPHRYGMYVATAVTDTGMRPDMDETAKVEWIPMADIPRLIRTGEITDGPSLTGLSFYVGTHRVDT